ncbi:MarR family winged helix-turn-helix transcriptional regulator [Arthrobacter sp. 35W]|uniref:MarR family winged helix-turn-helix transcriptional regulator n=1 Tax=Arthrobacter sp. 35W TaxID=1132441 RepID=UPI0003FB2A1E|nr:transcriptional regulator [Arthrobacter sp. 35W]
MATERPIGFWLKLVDSLISAQFEAIVEEHGITRRQWQIMNLLHEGPQTSSDIDAALKPFHDDPGDPLASEQMAELLESGWIEDDDGSYSLTPHGQTSLASISEVVRRNREQVAQGIPEEEYEATLDVLQRMARNLGWTEPEG